MTNVNFGYTLNKWALYGEISSSELWLGAILETY